MSGFVEEVFNVVLLQGSANVLADVRGAAINGHLSLFPGGGVRAWGEEKGTGGFDLRDTSFSGNGNSQAPSCQFAAVDATGQMLRCNFGGASTAVCVSNPGKGTGGPSLFDHVVVSSGAKGYDLSGATVTLRHCTVRATTTGGLAAGDSRVTITNGLFERTGHDQIAVASGCNISILQTVIDGAAVFALPPGVPLPPVSGVGISVGTGSNLTVTVSHIMNHSAFGILKVPAQAPVVLARNNYWGAPGGPANPANTSPLPKGNAVSNFVDFTSPRATPFPSTLVGPQ